MFIKIAMQQSKEIRNLDTDLRLEKETNAELRNENLDLKLEIRHLEQFKKSVVSIMTEKGTIVDKYDKIKELVDNLQTEN